ncbi:hypothetical protein [Pseudogemmobacter bohemicus]|uniref:hypothetical protein n=1 Tax=Pseudogemmobacter bohemicus TaxID=2250708 RepID=UPI0013005B32|nr:hypothetical protein [Pseudogemmobacter bohemicus]
MIITSNMQAALNSGSVVPRWMFWIRATNRATGAVEQSGIWNGLEPVSVVIDGIAREYGAAGAMLSIPQFEFTSDLAVKQQNVSLSMLSPEIVQMIKGYDAKFAPVEIHLALIDPDTDQLIGVTRAFRGWLDTVSISEDESSAVASLNLVTSARSGTAGLTLSQSNASQLARDPTDKGRSYAAISTKVKFSWGAHTDLVPQHRAYIGGQPTAAEVIISRFIK